MGLEVLHVPQQAARAVMDMLGLNRSGPSSSSQFEILRATVWGATVGGGDVHINRLLAAALPTWRLISERATVSDEVLREELRAALSTLEDTGDLIQLGGGYWCPATARLVDLPAGAGRLLIGGVPSSILPIKSDTIHYHGPHRHLVNPAPELTTALPIEDFTSWSRMPNVSLQDWASEVIGSFERQPYSPDTAESFEFYIPISARRGAPQYKRWIESVGDISCKGLLARRMRLYGAREYRLVDVRAGRIVGACDLQGVDVRRLMYALDQEAKNPVHARQLSATENPEWLFTSELPRAEQRAFAAFGTLTIPNDRPWERRWSFSRSETLAREMLHSLGVTIDQDREVRR